MRYYEVWLADNRYHGNTPLTYASEETLKPLSVVSVPLRSALATGFITRQVDQPSFAVKQIKSVLSKKQLPYHCLSLAEWISNYYQCGYSEALRQFAPSVPMVRRSKDTEDNSSANAGLKFDDPLTKEQTNALKQIEAHPSTTVLLHGDTGSGKTRVYLELAERTLSSGRSVIILTPEIALTTQLRVAAENKLNSPVFVLHSELSAAQRKKIWFSILEAEQPVVVIGPRSALFAPLEAPGLIVVDESHEPAYKQEQSPRYHAVRVASQLGALTSSKVILGSATPSVNDYFLASKHQAVVRMRLQAKSQSLAEVKTDVVDLRDKSQFTKNRYLSNKLIDAISLCLASHKQVLIYFNRRGSARLILCERCGWQMLCPNCDIPLTYHGDSHTADCHVCGHKKSPPAACPNCSNPDIIYASIGTKALSGIIENLFPSARVRRFDSDNLKGERLDESYIDLHSGEIDILVGTQLLAKGLDLPNLSLVGIISAETSLTLPDYTSEERTFQLLYQVIGRVGRHGAGEVIIQTYQPDSPLIGAASERNFEDFYENLLQERKAYRFPPFSYLMKLVCRRATATGAETAAERLKEELLGLGLPVEIAGPSPSFYPRRGNNYYYQLVIKSKDRKHLTTLARQVPSGWQIDMDPMDLL